MLRSREGGEAVRGGLDLMLSLTADQADALGVDAGELAEQLDTVLVGIAALRTGADPAVPADGGASFKDRPATRGGHWDEWLLRDVSALLARLEGVREAAVRAHAVHGGSYGMLAAAMGVTRATAQARRDARAVPGPAELWATGTHAPVNHSGAKVPANMKTWATAWPGYIPVDITPEELLPATLSTAVAEGWAEPYAEPSDVPDWSERQAAALVPFDLDDQWRPLNPTGRTGRTGRNLGRWGENQAADPIVVAGRGAERRVLLIRRSDIGQWAIPGGMVDPGETAPATLVRELLEETGVDLAEQNPRILTRTYVEDWRNTDHAWVASTVALYHLPDVVPAVAGDDATDARWWPLTNLGELVETLQTHGGMYEAHRPLLAQALIHLAADSGAAAREQLRAGLDEIRAGLDRAHREGR